MTERVILPIHGADHCPGGPDPIPCLSTPAIIFSGYDFSGVGDNLVADDTWEAVAQAGPTRWWLEGQATEGWTYDLDTGIITRQDFGLYTAFGSAAFPGTVGGETIGVSLKFAGSNNFFYTNSFVIPASGLIPHSRCTVAATWWGDLDPGVDMHVYQLSGAAMELGMVTMAIYLQRPLVLGDGYFEHA